MLFHAKMGILGNYLYVSHTLFILYLEGNHTLFGDKLYFIGNLAVATLQLDLSGQTPESVQNCFLKGWLVVFNVPSTTRSFRDGAPFRGLFLIIWPQQGAK